MTEEVGGTQQVGKWEREGSHMVYIGEADERTKELVRMKNETPYTPPKPTVLEWLCNHEMLVAIVVSVITSVVVSVWTNLARLQP